MEQSYPTRWFLAACALALLSSSAHAQSGDVVISSNTTWSENSYSLDSLRVESGGTLTVAGGSTVSVVGAVVVSGNSKILLQGKNATGQVAGEWAGVGVTIAAGSVQVDSGSRISADAQGYGTSMGPGGGDFYMKGGTHGGSGLNNTTATYGSYLAPTDLGSGGGAAGGTSAGGGAIRLVVSGTLINNGMITADAGPSGPGEGGGAGGSLYVSAGTIAGFGGFTANGTLGPHNAGGGGRVSITYTIDGGFNRVAVTANAGGAGATAGSVYLLENGVNLYVPTALALPPETHASYTNVTVYSGATLSLGGGASLTISGTLYVTHDSTILVQATNNTAQVAGMWQGTGGTITTHTLLLDTGSRITADGQGYATFLGPGGGDFYMKGGTYGGSGSNNTTAPYGSYLTPIDLGSGGGAAGGTSAGGGAIRLIVTGILTNHGTISADGGTSGTVKGGGAGGSLYITAGTMAGTGWFTANGTAGPHNAGGGGRVSIAYAVDGGFNRGHVTANAGGNGATPGTVYVLEQDANLYVPTALVLPPDSLNAYANVTVEGGATLTLLGGATLTVSDTLLVTGNSTVLVQSKDNTGQVGGTWRGAGGTITAHTLLVDAGSRISADAQGYGTALGPGGGDFYTKGGTYGGSGSNNTTATYGSYLTPTDLGSGGGAAGGTSVGGGAIRVIVTGTLTNHGTITADGGGSTGGGAGGSLYVTTGTLAGGGTFTADGARAFHAAGGGGRIAIYYSTSTFNQAAITASAGDARAAAGTVALVVSPPTLTSVLPASAPVGAAVALTGTGFTWTTEVRFQALIPSLFTIVSDTQITTTVPAGAVSGPIVVVTAGGAATSAASFLVISPPTLTSVAPGMGGVGAAVTLTGTGFTCATQVWFDATMQPTFTIVSDTQITTTVPAGAVSGRVQVVNPAGTASTHGDFTVIVDADLDGLPDEWELRFGLDSTSNPTDHGMTADPDGDGRTNLEEFEAGTHPRGFFTRYFAEGAASSFFDTTLALLNPSLNAATVLLRFQKSDCTSISHYLAFPGRTRKTVSTNEVGGMATAEFSTVIESDEALVADRTMTWDAAGYGSHAETSVPSPATTWYLAEGATHSGFNLFYLIQNPNPQTVHVEVTYLLPAPTAPIVRTYAVDPTSRFNIWVDTEGAALEHTDVSAILMSDLPIIVERAMYLDQPGVPFAAGHESAGITTPSAAWFLAEGATGPYFDLFVLIANPSNTDASVTATFLLPTGDTVVQPYTVAARSRFNVWVDTIPGLEDTAVSTILESTTPIIVERAMWWPGPTAATWAEAHNSAGLTATGRRWAMADGEVGGSRGVETYILIANRGDANTARVTILYEDGTTEAQEVWLPAQSRTNVSVAAFFPNAVGRRFGAIVEGLRPDSQIAVERAMYSNAGGVVWAAGTNAVATKLQ
jgi:hypothetical protein